MRDFEIDEDQETGSITLCLLNEYGRTTVELTKDDAIMLRDMLNDTID